MAAVIEKINTLTPSQKTLFQAIREGRNVCCLGPGGTGKTYTIELAMQYAKEQGLNVVVCAPTGIAAVNIGGMTIHHTFAADFGILPPNTMKTSNLLEAADIIIIDEISMVRRDLFEFVIRSIHLAQINAIEKGVSNRLQKQLVVCGDFGQLPPVLVPAEKDEYAKIYGSRFAFTSRQWTKMNFVYVVLKEQMRQKDTAFAAKLARVRSGDSTVLAAFHQNDAKSETAITLCTNNYTADKINQEHLMQLSGQHEYYAETFGGIKNDEMPVPPRMVLAPDEHVMFVNNDREGRWSNGSLATIVACYDDCVEVRMHNGVNLAIRPETWTIYRDEVQAQKVFPSGKVQHVIVHSRAGYYSQYPLRPAWAITVHRAQGQTYEEVNIAPGHFFDSGQLYVALSRCRTECGLHITGSLRESDLIVDDEILNFLEHVNNMAINR